MARHPRAGDLASPPARPPRRTRYPNLSPTRPPAVEADLGLWPAWTHVPVERIDPRFIQDFPCPRED